jgi:hypothetical protein
MSKPFNPNDGLIKVQGNREYLPVASRSLWFRKEYPEWAIETDAVQLDYVNNYAVFRCTIRDEQGRIRSQATKMEDKAGFGDFTEKAETGSVGRALAFLGYGVLGAKDFEEGERFADAPQEIREPAQPTAPPDEPDPRYSLLDALYEQAHLLELSDLAPKGDIKGLSKLAGTICRWTGREVGKSLTTDDILTAITNIRLWDADMRAPIVTAPAQTDYPEDNLPEIKDGHPTEDTSTPTFADGALFAAPAPSMPTPGNYANGEYRGKDAEPTGGKRKVS